MKRFKKVLSLLILTVLLFTSFPLQAEAKVNTKALYNDTFLQLSEEDKEDTMRYLTYLVANDLGITREIRVDFYNVADWPEIASNSVLEFTIYDEIRYNMSGFTNTVEADHRGESMEHFVVSVIAHEVRHTYQLLHMYDKDIYGTLVYNGRNNYQGTYSGNYSAYYSNFVEVDARAFGSVYADNYLSNKSRNVLMTNNGKVFDPVFYANTYADVKNALGTNQSVLLDHYNTYGINEHRMANAYDLNP